MFVEREREHNWLWVFTRMHGSILPHIWLRVVTVTLVAIAYTYLHDRNIFRLEFSPTPFALVGLPLGVFLGFRNNAAYDRFWEGRKLWGALVNTSRTVTRQILTIVRLPADAAEAERAELRAFQEENVRRVMAYVHALRHHLRKTAPWDDIDGFLPADEVERLKIEGNVPIAILQTLGERFQDARTRGWLDVFHVPVMEGSLTSFTDIQGGCERILKTPIPFSYTVLVHRLVAAYVVLLPCGLADTLHWSTPIVSTFVGYGLLGLDAIGSELEEPFGRDPNDLPLGGLSRTIENNLRQRLGEAPDTLPAPWPVVNGVQD